MCVGVLREVYVSVCVSGGGGVHRCVRVSKSVRICIRVCVPVCMRRHLLSFVK
jgi:hypothetical protein